MLLVRRSLVLILCNAADSSCRRKPLFQHFLALDTVLKYRVVSFFAEKPEAPSATPKVALALDLPTNQAAADGLHLPHCSSQERLGILPIDLRHASLDHRKVDIHTADLADSNGAPIPINAARRHQLQAIPCVPGELPTGDRSHHWLLRR